MKTRYETSHVVMDNELNKVVCICSPPGTDASKVLAEHIVDLLNKDEAKQYVRSKS